MTPKIRDIRTIATAPSGINLLVVKVETTEPGLYGLGCATLTYRVATIQNLIDVYVKPLLIGREVDRITEIWQLLHQNAYWRSGPIENNAISGIDMALWDIKGKMANMPIYQLLGGKVRDGVPVYRHADGATVDELCESIQELQEMGMHHVRCQLNTYGGTEYGQTPAGAAKGVLPGIYLNPRQYMNETVKLFDQLRSRLGDEIELVHDVHERIHPTQAREFCREMDPFHLFFLEDVVSPENIGWLKDIRAHCTTPLSHGELDANVHEWRQPVMDRSIDFVRAHISDLGGLTPALKMAGFAEQFAVRTCWHCPPDMSPVAAACNVHLDLTLPNFGLQEWSGIKTYKFMQINAGHPDAMEEVFTGFPEYGNDGYVYVKDTPGHGVDIDEKAAANYPCEWVVSTWTQTRNLDGSLQTP